MPNDKEVRVLCVPWKRLLEYQDLPSFEFPGHCEVTSVALP